MCRILRVNLDPRGPKARIQLGTNGEWELWETILGDGCDMYGPSQVLLVPFRTWYIVWTVVSSTHWLVPVVKSTGPAQVTWISGYKVIFDRSPKGLMWGIHQEQKLPWVDTLGFGFLGSTTQVPLASWNLTQPYYNTLLQYKSQICIHMYLR